MGKIMAWTTILVLLSNLAAPAGTAWAYTEKSRTVSEEQIAEGVKVNTIKIETTEGPLNVYVMTVDLTNPYVKIDTLVGTGGVITKNQSVTNLAREAGAVAAINADFFQMKERAPIGLTVQAGEIVTSPALTSSMHAFGLTKDNTPVFGLFGFTGIVTAPLTGARFQLSGINKPTYLVAKDVNSDINRLNMYTPRWGSKSRGALPGLTGIVEMVVEEDIVKELRFDQPGVDIPWNGYILAGHGTAAQFLTSNFKVGDPVEKSYMVSPETDNLAAAVGGQAILVKDGKRHWFSNNIYGKHARTAIGASQDGRTLYLAVIEGGSNSRGMTQEELADFMISIGAWTALNLDGGGSSTMAARHLGDQTVSLINTPVYTSERLVPTALGIFSTAPKGDLAGLRVTGPQLILVGTGRSYTAKGYDEHYNPYPVAQDQVTWEVSPNLGEFTGGTFKPSSGGEGTIKATYQGISQEYPVKVLGSNDIAKLEVTPGLIALNPGESVNLTVKVTTRQGSVFVLQPGEYDVTVKGDIGTFSNGKFTAAGHMALGELSVKIDSTTKTVKASVGGTEKPYYDFEGAKAVRYRSIPEGEVPGGFRYTAVGEPAFRGMSAGRLEYDFTKTSKTRIAYGTFEGGLGLTGQPLGLGLWVKGDQGNGHWLRARITDADGREKLLDLAKAVDWEGWKHVSVNIPSDVKHPVKLTDIYLVETEGGPQDKGVIYFDQLSLITPPLADEIGQKPPEELASSAELAPGVPVSMQVGRELTMKFLNPPDSPAYDITVRQVWQTDLPTPGCNPLAPLYRSTAAADGDEVRQLKEPFKITLEVKDVNSIQKVRLMFWDETRSGWQQVPAAADLKAGSVMAKTNRLGLFGLMEDVRPLPAFTDTETHWARDLITNLAAGGIVNGYPDGSFQPARGITRAEFITLLANVLGWAPETSRYGFKDTIPAWAQGSIGAAVNRGVVKGYDDGTFKPQKVITRAEMAVILDKALVLADSSQPSNYRDARLIPSWAVQSIRDTKVTGIMQGSDNLFRPGDIANRAEATAVMAKALDYYISG